MLLLIDMGNSNIVVGRMRMPENEGVTEKLREYVVDGKGSAEAEKAFPQEFQKDLARWKFDFENPFLDRILTDRRMNREDYRDRFLELFRMHGIRPQEIKGCIMSSTVPVLTAIVKGAIEDLIDRPVLNLTGNTPCGMTIHRERPETLGADIIAGAVGAIYLYDCPVIVADMGTCTTIAVVDRNAGYIGGIIMPGVKTSLDGMQSNAPHLPEILYEKPEHVIGTDTITGIQSGLMYGHAGAVEGLIHNMWKELGYETKIVATGGFSKRVMSCTGLQYNLERDLIFKGLAVIYMMNLK